MGAAYPRLIGAAAMLLLLVGCTPASTRSEHANSTAGTQVKMEVVAIKKLDVDLEVTTELRFARISGLSDRAVEKKINARLRDDAERVLDQFLDVVKFHYADDYARAEEGTWLGGTLSSSVTIGLRGPRLASVHYIFENSLGVTSAEARAESSLVVDLATGRELTARNLLSPAVRTREGAAEFTKLLAGFGPGGRLCDTPPLDDPGSGTRAFQPDDIAPPDGKEGVVGIFPAEDAVTFTLGLWKLGYPMVCNGQQITIDYPSLDGLLDRVLTRS